MNFNNVLKSKYLYYAAVALMAINVLGYVSLGSIECVLVLGGAAYLANQFTKNRTVDIFIGLFVSNILFGCGRLKEGIENHAKTPADRAMETASAINKSASNDKIKSKNCPKGEEWKNGNCAAIKASLAQKVAAVGKTLTSVDKEKEGGKQGFFN